MKRLSILLLLLIFAVPVFAQDNDPATADLAWDANTETDLAGYRVYQGTVSGSYVQIAELPGAPASPAYTTVRLANGTYFFVVTAYNTSGLESGFSNEVTATINTAPLPPGNLRQILDTVGQSLKVLGDYLIAESKK